MPRESYAVDLALQEVSGWEKLSEDEVDHWVRKHRGPWYSLQKLTEEQPSDERGLTWEECRALYLHQRGW